MKYNYHTHTPLCRHANGDEEEYVQTAINGGKEILGFSDHSPMIFNSDHYSGYRMYPADTEKYFDKLLSLREKYKDYIRILIGLELEYYPTTFDQTLKFLSAYPLDYLIIGEHFCDEDEEKYSGSIGEDSDQLHLYFERILTALRTGKYLYPAHPDLARYSGPEEIYEKEARAFCEEVKRLGYPLEINFLGLMDGRHYPCDRFFRIAAEVGNKVIFGCDAHRPEYVNERGVLKAGSEFVDRLGLELCDGMTIFDGYQNPLEGIR